MQIPHSGLVTSGCSAHFASGHPLASVARSRCIEAHGPGCRLVGGMACGACWERVIRDDERVAVLFGLPRVLDTDPAYVDVVVVERACAGERLRLSDTERRAAVMVLVDRGYSVTRIARRLHMSHAMARALLAELLADLGSGHATDDQADDAAMDGRAA